MQKTPLAVAIVIVILVRVWFWFSTGQTLEDAMITFRYAESIAAGQGFVYNAGEHVQGTSSPLWTLLLAGMRTLGGPDIITTAKILGILFDVGTSLLILLSLRGGTPLPSVVFATMFSLSPWIVPISVSGMETPLLLFSLAVSWYGLQKKSFALGVGLALTALTRIDGLLFVVIALGWAFTRDVRWALRQAGVVLLLCLPWFLFAMMYFGQMLPQSYVAKRAVYEFSIATSAAPFLNMFTPLGETRPLLFAGKLLWSLLLVVSLFMPFIRRTAERPIAIFFFTYTVMFALSGMLIFSWYLVPPAFAGMLLVAAAVRPGIPGLKALRPRMVTPTMILLFAGLVAINIFPLSARMQKARDLQRYENQVRLPLGRWLGEHTPAGTTILLEPIGYVGFYAGRGRRILDEIGIVTPQIVRFRQQGVGWYADALRALDPDLLVQYANALRTNRSEGDAQPLFAHEGDRGWFTSHYVEIARFSLKEDILWMEEKEKEFVVFQRR